MYWLNEDSRKFLAAGYLKKGESAEQRMKDISDYAESRLWGGFGERFLGYLHKGYYSLSSPVWANYARKDLKPAGISCFGCRVGDSIEEILYSASEVGTQTKLGGGTSAYFGDIRGAGSPISGGGKSDGVIPFLKIFETVSQVCKQSDVRRGSFAAYLPIEHPDILDFIKIRTKGHQIQQLFPAVVVKDAWIQSMIDGDAQKRKVWAELLKSRTMVGTPYISFYDAMNRGKSDCYKDLEIVSSNLCVSGDTEILTKEGQISIKDLVDKEVVVWNGYEWSKATPRLTAKNQNLAEVQVLNGVSISSIKCTLQHKWHLNDGRIVETKDLKRWDTLKLWETPNGETISQYVLNWYMLEDKEDTYCFTEPLRNLGVFNGILTGNCNEIALPLAHDESFVCCLSSINLLHWDEIEKTDAVETLIYFLDTVMSEFIEKTDGVKFMERPNKFARRHRALGMGTLGWHSYLQSKMIPFDSLSAHFLNNRIFKAMQERSYQASEDLAKKFGGCEITSGYGRRNSTTMAIAPTQSSSYIHGQVSPSIEPWTGNRHVEKKAKAITVYTNQELKKVFQSLGIDNEETWDKIEKDNGSVQNLNLPEDVREVFKVFREISQKSIVIQAGNRQRYIDQGQSLNLSIPPSTPAKEVNDITLEAWRQGCKGLYYQIGENAAQNVKRDLMACKSCEG
jgi:ribonucleotide reductase alpha subunit